ncbi:DUF1120 domain-containing protein [Pseudomonas sp. BCA14]|uniref:DUF1120 domain-containing protein n=1 Tax=unclassified Pseudomonas TaxID=196821 RepID=UPI00106E391B|nr:MULTISPECIES: DUF1120 domain-containing protein [unclassified Pseudomonas]TFF09937.1 DUF1120 domain-containing protein [Pseudomonas sp. JMN1]TFF12079.1 DUF1120 domain-containing protein [Pseudomonas sp. BCA17]TFF28855.1 DUF1120 domain-containing protein [Pseudomonas sp. BCA14]
MGLKPVLLAAVLLLANPAWATEECRLNLSESRLDFGLMNRAVALVPAPERLLGERRFSLNLNCPQATDMTLLYRGLAATVERFRFTERGSYDLQASDAVLDGQPVELGLVAGIGQAPGAVATSLRWRPGHGIVPMRAGVPVIGRSLSVQLQASAWVGEDAARVSDAVTWETSGLFDAVNAGRSRELSLLARFAPAACTPTLSNGGHVALGKLSISDLSQTQDTPLPPRPVVLNVACDAPTYFAVRMQDNRPGSATGDVDASAYGLGLDARQQKIGRYRLAFDPNQASADGHAQLYRTDSATGGLPWSSASSSPLAVAADRYLGFGTGAGSTSGPVAIQNLSATASLEALIAPLSGLDLGSEVRLDGAATLEIHYL